MSNFIDNLTAMLDFSNRIDLTGHIAYSVQFIGYISNSENLHYYFA